MTAIEWFRNTEWTAETEARFEEKLRRAKDKSQYLRIQACTLASSRPEIALQLLGRYFEMGDHFDLAQAHVDSAMAHLALGKSSEALDAFERALDREAVFPKLKTSAFVEYPFLVATEAYSDRYASALKILDERSREVMFPVDRFKWNASKALILASRREVSAARSFAAKALIAAEEDHSGFRHHPSIGLVGNKFANIREQLQKILMPPSA